MSEEKLKKPTGKQLVFCKEYIVDFNGTQAAIRAGFTTKSPRQTATELLAKPYIRAYTDKLIKSRVEKAQIDGDYVLRRLLEIDRLDVLDIVNDNLEGFRPLNEWPKEWRISISGIDIKKVMAVGDDTPLEQVISKIKWPDKTRNLELLGKHTKVGAFQEQQRETQDLGDVLSEIAAAVKV